LLFSRRVIPPKNNRALAEVAVEVLADTQISHQGMQCPTIKNNCGVNGHYEQWEQDDGQLACACNY